MTGQTPRETLFSSTFRRPSLVGIGAATGMPPVRSHILRVAASARRWNSDGEADNFAMRRLPSIVTHASRFRSLMTRRSQSSTAMPRCPRGRHPASWPRKEHRQSRTARSRLLRGQLTPTACSLSAGHHNRTVNQFSRAWVRECTESQHGGEATARKIGVSGKEPVNAVFARWRHKNVGLASNNMPARICPLDQAKLGQIGAPVAVVISVAALKGPTTQS